MVFQPKEVEVSKSPCTQHPKMVCNSAPSSPSAYFELLSLEAKYSVKRHGKENKDGCWKFPLAEVANSFRHENGRSAMLRQAEEDKSER